MQYSWMWVLEACFRVGQYEIHLTVFRDIYLKYISISFQVLDYLREINSREVEAEAYIAALY